LGEPSLDNGIGLGFETAIELGLLLGRELSEAAIRTSFVEHIVSGWRGFIVEKRGKVCW
jgi:hypothetical protein